MLVQKYSKHIPRSLNLSSPGHLNLIYETGITLEQDPSVCTSQCLFFFLNIFANWLHLHDLILNFAALPMSRVSQSFTLKQTHSQKWNHSVRHSKVEGTAEFENHKNNMWWLMQAETVTWPQNNIRDHFFKGQTPCYKLNYEDAVSPTLTTLLS